MPRYDYEYQTQNGEPTGEYVELYHKISECPLKVCPNTGRPIARAFLTAPNMIMDNNKPKTIGALADKNTREMIKRGDKRVAPKPKPWWRDKDKPVNIRGWNKKKIQKYIATGEK